MPPNGTCHVGQGCITYAPGKAGRIAREFVEKANGPILVIQDPDGKRMPICHRYKDRYGHSTFPILMRKKRNSGGPLISTDASIRVSKSRRDATHAEPAKHNKPAVGRQQRVDRMIEQKLKQLVKEVQEIAQVAAVAAPKLANSLTARGQSLLSDGWGCSDYALGGNLRDGADSQQALNVAAEKAVPEEGAAMAEQVPLTHPSGATSDHPMSSEIHREMFYKRNKQRHSSCGDVGYELERGSQGGGDGAGAGPCELGGERAGEGGGEGGVDEGGGEGGSKGGGKGMRGGGEGGGGKDGQPAGRALPLDTTKPAALTMLNKVTGRLENHLKARTHFEPVALVHGELTQLADFIPQWLAYRDAYDAGRRGCEATTG